MQNKPLFKIVLYTPEIPGNTGSIGRTCVALGLEMILIGPCGFDLSEKAVRRAGLDYWKYVQLKLYPDWESFFKQEAPERDKMFFYENHQDRTFYQADYQEGCYLIFGAETKGLPQSICEQYADRIFCLPMYSDKIRSLNLSNAATAAAYECLRHLKFS